MPTRRKFIGAMFGAGAALSTGAQPLCSQHPNVSIKLSNLPTASLEPYPFRDLTPHIHRVFDAYGPQRCYWGTDVTNGLARVNWRQRLTHIAETLDFLNEEDKDWVMGRAILARLGWA